MFATSAPSSQVFEIPQTSLSLEIPRSSQPSVVPEEATTMLEISNLELQVTEDMGDLLANFPEGWLEGETKMYYHTTEAAWGDNGIPEAEIKKK